MECARCFALPDRMSTVLHLSPNRGTVLVCGRHRSQHMYLIVLRSFQLQKQPRTYLMMRGICQVAARAPICRPTKTAALPRWQAARSIYTSASGIRPYGFQSQAQQWQQEQQQSRSRSHGPTGFVPVPFVTEQLAGATHSSDLFSRYRPPRP